MQTAPRRRLPCRSEEEEEGRACTHGAYPARFVSCRKEFFVSKQKIQLSDHFTYPRLLRFVLPAVGTMLFTSIYGLSLIHI